MKIDFSEVRNAYPVPAHIEACARAIAYDLWHGPSYSLIPHEGIEAFTSDHFAAFASDLDETQGSITETYSGPVADALADFMRDLPSTLYVDESGYLLGESEPEPWTDGEGWFEPEPCYVLSSREIVAALFGDFLAKEFSY